MQEIDVTNLACPLPLLKAKVALRELQPGEQLKVLVTDAASVRDFAVYAELSGNTLISSTIEDDVYIHILQKA